MFKANRKTPDIAARTHSLLPVAHDSDDSFYDSDDAQLLRNTEQNSRAEQYYESPPQPKRNLDRAVSFLESVEVIGYLDADDDYFSLPADMINVRVSSHFYGQTFEQAYGSLDAEQAPTPTISPLVAPDSPFTIKSDYSLMDELMNEDMYADYFTESPRPFVESSEEHSLPSSNESLLVEVIPTVEEYIPTPVKKMVSTASQEDREVTFAIEEPKPKKKIRHVQIQVRIPSHEVFTQTEGHMETSDAHRNQLIASQAECDKLREERLLVGELASDLKLQLETMRNINEELERDRLEKDLLMDKAHEQMKQLLMERDAGQMLVDYLYGVIGQGNGV